jgi:1-aminocyclopropane-1-carboxylate deaminase
MTLNIKLPSPVTALSGEYSFENKPLAQKLRQQNISVFCKRDDLIHPIISGNKWRKLSACLALIEQINAKHVMSFGGAHSNHLHALAWVCKSLNIKFTAVIRGDYSKNLTPTLRDLLSWNTQLHYVTKIDYKKRTQAQYCQSLSQQIGADYIIPEGGSHKHSMQGVGELLSEIEAQHSDLTHILLPVASGGTLAGLIGSNALPNTKLIGIGVLKGEGYLENLVDDLLTQSNISKHNKDWKINHAFHHGGYAKSSDTLTEFVQAFNQHQIKCHEANMAIEPVYSGKCFYALYTLLAENYFAPNSKILILHTGGLQGART